eukprot:6135790-Amphidinium_carterae.1
MISNDAWTSLGVVLEDCIEFFARSNLATDGNVLKAVTSSGRKNKVAQLLLTVFVLMKSQHKDIFTCCQICSANIPQGLRSCIPPRILPLARTLAGPIFSREEYNEIGNRGAVGGGHHMQCVRLRSAVQQVHRREDGVRVTLCLQGAKQLPKLFTDCNSAFGLPTEVGFRCQCEYVAPCQQRAVKCNNAECTSA